MTKAELVEKAAKDAKISKVAAAAALNSFMDGVTKALKKKNGKVTLVGFGTFQKVRRKARKGRNPQTGAPIKIKATNVVKFRPGTKLRDAVSIGHKKSKRAICARHKSPVLFSEAIFKMHLTANGCVSP